MLIEVVLNESLLNDYNKEPFWDDSVDGDSYSELENIKVPDYSEIQQYQLSKVEDFAQNSIKNIGVNKEKLQAINELFKSNINQLINEQDKKDELILEDVVTKIMNLIEEQRAVKKYDPSKANTRKQDYQKMQQSFTNLANILEDLKNKLSIKSVVYDRDLNKLHAAIQENSLKSFNQNVLKAWLDNLNSIKGELLEEIGTAWLNKVIPQQFKVKAFTTGKLTLQDSNLSSGRHSGMLIQDLMLLDMKQVDLNKSIHISFKVNGQEKTMMLKDFLNYMSNFNKNGMISLPDESYTALTKLSIFNIQAKSGFYQKPWNNEAEYNKVSIQEFSPDGGYDVPHILNLLQSLYNEETPTNERWVQDEAMAYKLLAYYGVGSVLDKVLSLNGAEGNQYLLTPSGFISYAERMKQLFQGRNRGIFTVKGDIFLSDDSLLSQLRSVSLGRES